MAKKKKNKGDGSGIGGKIITALFLLILVGGAYALFTMFRGVEINEQNLAGEWKLPGSPVVYYQFNLDGTASSYEKFTGTGRIDNAVYYTYTLEDDVLTLYEVDSDRQEVITITSLSQAQLSVIMNRSDMEALTRVDLF